MGDTNSRPAPGGNDPSNRRKHPRFRPPECEITISRETSGIFKFLSRVDTSNMASNLYDISEGGIRASVKERLADGSKVRVRFKVLKFNDEVNQEGIVVWTMPHAYRNDLFIIGIRFDKIDAAGKRVIAAMRSYFTSPEFRLKTETRTRVNPNPPS